MEVPQVDPIGFDIPASDIYPSFTDRYFQSKYFINANNIEGEDHCVLIHSNRICVVTLAPSHPVISSQKTISKLNFQTSENKDRLKNTVQGKRKHGAQCLNPSSILCVIECDDGSKYSVRSCVYGKLIEINESLIKDQQLLVKKPKSDGYIAIVLPNLTSSEKFKSDLLSEEDYQTAVNSRQIKANNEEP